MSGRSGPKAQFAHNVLRKGGHPLLYLPINPKAASCGVELYPAQTRLARAMKWGLRRTAGLGLAKLCTEQIETEVSADDPFAKFIARLAGSGERLPQFAMLAGNPNAPGQRLILCLFDSQDEPVAVVKAGVTPEARALIAREAGVLNAVSARFSTVPRLRGRYQSPHLEAMALDFLKGCAPAGDDIAGIAGVLTSWLSDGERKPLEDFDAWKRLRAACEHLSAWQTLDEQLAARPVQPALFHGDFAPWNIRVLRDGTWMVLDWERGVLNGIPAWDWLHYVSQQAVLIHRKETRDLVATVESLLQALPFREYAKRASISEIIQPLTIAYLLYCTKVLRQTEGLEAVRKLFSALTARWKRHT